MVRWWIGFFYSGWYIADVTIVVLKDDGPDGLEVLLAKKVRGLTTGWVLPGGCLDRELGVWGTVIEELMEETGVEVTKTVSLGPIVKEGSVHLLFLALEPYTPIWVKDKVEIAEAGYFPIDKAVSMLANNDFRVCLKRAIEAFRLERNRVQQERRLGETNIPLGAR